MINFLKVQKQEGIKPTVNKDKEYSDKGVSQQLFTLQSSAKIHP
jgi:hypothetical protein